MTSTTLDNWRRAAEELNFLFVSPFALEGDTPRSCFAHVPDFGAGNGMIVVLEHDPELATSAKENGFGYSCLFESSEAYAVVDFIDVLNDWTWSNGA